MPSTCVCTRRPWMMVLSIVALLFVTVPDSRAQMADHPENQPLRVAADVGYAPFAMQNPSGEVEGFSVDVARELAKRLGRPGFEIVDVNWSAIFSGLFAKRYEFNIAPTNITHERAKRMLFTEGYMETGLGFLTLSSVPELKSADELRGKVIAVNRGSVSDTWATENAPTYGFTVQRYDKQADAVQAVLTRRAFTVIGELPNTQYISTRQPRTQVRFVVYTHRQFGFPFRPDDAAFRNKIERLVEGMKLDGTMAMLHKKWFGAMPGPDTAMSKVWVGYGPVGYQGYVYEPHAPEFP